MEKWWWQKTYGWLWFCGKSFVLAFFYWYFFCIRIPGWGPARIPVGLCGQKYKFSGATRWQSLTQSLTSQLCERLVGIKLGICGHISDIYSNSSLHERAVCFVVQVRSTESSSFHHHGTQCEDSTRQVGNRGSPHTRWSLVVSDMIWERWKHK